MEETLLDPLLIIVGFFVTYYFNKKNYYYELQKQKNSKQLEELIGLQDLIQKIINDLERSTIGTESKTLHESNNLLRTKMYSIGSADATKIFSTIDNVIYLCLDSKNSLPIQSLLCMYVLLLMQVKYDHTGEKVSPELWFRGRYGTPDVIEAYANAKRITNALVDSLSLSSFLKFEDDITVDRKYSDILTYLVSE